MSLRGLCGLPQSNAYQWVHFLGHAVAASLRRECPTRSNQSARGGRLVNGPTVAFRMPFVERRRQAMNEDFNKEKSAILIEEARAITAELRSEIAILEAQMRQVSRAARWMRTNVMRPTQERCEVNKSQLLLRS